MKPETRWAAWLIGAVATFLALEVPALLRREPGKQSIETATYQVRTVLGTRRDDKRARRFVTIPAFVSGVVAAAVYCVGHFCYDRWNT